MAKPAEVDVAGRDVAGHFAVGAHLVYGERNYGSNEDDENSRAQQRESSVAGQVLEAFESIHPKWSAQWFGVAVERWSELLALSNDRSAVYRPPGVVNSISWWSRLLTMGT